MRSSVLPLLCAIAVLGACRAQEPQTEVTTNGLSVAGVFPVQVSASTSADQVQRELSQTIDTVNANMVEGVQILMEPLVNFFFKTAPNITHLYGLMQGGPVRREVVNFANGMWGQGAKMAQLMGRGMVSGSNFARGAMELSGQALNGLHGAVNKATEAGMNMAYKMIDGVVKLEMNGLDMLDRALQMVEKGLQDAGPRAKALTDNFQVTLKAVEDKIKVSIEDVQKIIAQILSETAKNVQDGSRKVQDSARQHLLNLLNSYNNVLERIIARLEPINNRMRAIESSSVQLVADTNPGLSVDTGVNVGLQLGSTGSGSADASGGLSTGFAATGSGSGDASGALSTGFAATGSGGADASGGLSTGFDAVTPLGGFNMNMRMG